MTLRHEPDVSRAAWFAQRDEPWTQLCCLGPSGFERYARLFAPLPEGLVVSGRQDVASLEGDLPDPTLRRLIAVLARHTGTPDDCLFALWDGYADVHGSPSVGITRAGVPAPTKDADPEVVPPAFAPEVMGAARVSIPNRSYLLFAGPLTEAGQWGAADLVPGLPRRINSPNLFWPADRAWFVATEVDQPWTGIGGTASLVADLAAEGLDVEPLALTDQPPYWR